MTAEVTLNKRYRLDRPLARGGMSEVWVGRDLHLERGVVVKLIRLPGDDGDGDLVRRSRREALLMARLDHPGIPAIYDYDLHNGQPYLVLEKIDGINVADLGAEHAPLPVGWAADIAAQAASVLAAAHAIDMIHRDIKPRNLMLDRTGMVKVLDFGLAASLRPGDLSRITRTGEFLGTVSYTAPEQVMGETPTPQTDLYGLGCTLYDLLTGQPPFGDDSQSGMAIAKRHLDESPGPPRRLRAEIPLVLEEIVLALLEKDPGDRPASATVVYRELAPFVTDLPMLPGVIGADTGVEAARAYITLCAKVPAAPGTQKRESERRFERADMVRARQEGQQLLAAAQFAGAARVLGAITEAAMARFGPDDEEVVNLRALRADALSRAGEHRPAAREHRALARDLAERDGPHDERVLEHRLRAARAHAGMGERVRARKQITQLLEDRIRQHGRDHSSVRALQQELDQLGP